MRLENETDPEMLRRAALLLEKENKRLVQKIIDLTNELVTVKGGGAEQLKLRIAELEQQLALRNRMLFGESSEKRIGDGPAPETSSEPPKLPQKGHGPKAQMHLPVVELKHELDEADRACAACGGRLEEWEGQSEDSEEIDVIERRFVIKKHKRQKYRCRCGGCVETAPSPLKLFEGARYSIDFAIEVAADKYCDHNPLERQVRKMAREGLDTDSQTLWDQIERVARLLAPGYLELMQYVLSKPVIGADETRWPLLGRKTTNRHDGMRGQSPLRMPWRTKSTMVARLKSRKRSWVTTRACSFATATACTNRSRRNRMVFRWRIAGHMYAANSSRPKRTSRRKARWPPT
jgi:transposase